MSVPGTERARPAEVLAGYMSVAAIFVAATALAVRPLPLAVSAIVLSLVAAGIGGQWGRLHAIAVGVSTVAFILGMTIAVVTGRALY
jgi:hypothetical protein